MLTIGSKLCPSNMAEAIDPTEVSDKPKDPKKMMICAGILIIVVLGMGFHKTVGIPMQSIAIIGALACVLTGCLTEKQAYLGIDWVTIFLFAGMLSLAGAMDKTGAGKMIADGVVSLMGSSPSPVIIVVAMFILSCGLTQFMSNTASAALLAPIGISIAQTVHVSPFPVLMAVGIAASCAFTTPVATPPNTLILGPGRFKFMDYVKVGIPLVIISLIVCSVVIPFFWPFTP
ncbi:anion transporter [Pectinatus brassicae]|uniref:Anion transporter n=1 Tax=Pectinatus brassicae TaxID=862415 RepID=A0A840URC3_9FIRM|nr:anion transporter [Pectinatus brassicae]